jgi:CubicO group peptidase (beta-lactamase class C family)
MGLRAEKFEDATRLIENEVRSRQVRAAVLHVRKGEQLVSRAFGAAQNPSAVFLIASITKPMTASAVMILSERKALSITDPVGKFIPEFRGEGRERINIRHLLTHTSGLPDMLPENEALRKRHAPLKEFVAATCRTPLLFAPGAKVSYQSMGILLAADIVERITKRSLPDFLRDELYGPLGMKDTSLGLGGRKIADTMQCEVEETGWDWNSAYWRNLGAPWGGAHSTAADIDRLLREFGHASGRVLTSATAAAMTTNQTSGLNKPWGLGWALRDGFGKRSSPRTFGHSGSTGTLAWFDPQRDTSFVLLTTRPAAISGPRLIVPVSDMISEAVGT